MINLITITLLIAGIALLFFVDSVIDKNTPNNTLKSIYDNKTIIGASCIAAGYYSYLLSQKNITTIDTPLAVPQHITEIGQVHLPSYNESIGTSEALNMSH